MLTNLAKFNRWYAQLRAWKAAHMESWSGQTTPGSDGLTQFQHRCRKAVLDVVPALTLKQTVEKETFLVGKLPGTGTTIYIYSSGANLRDVGYNLVCDEWDYKTPDELIGEFVRRVKKRAAVRSHDAAERA